jgi:hypothetical protein
MGSLHIHKIDDRDQVSFIFNSVWEACGSFVWRHSWWKLACTTTSKIWVGACALTPYNLGPPQPGTCEWDIFGCTCGLSWEDGPSRESVSAKRQQWLFHLCIVHTITMLLSTWLVLYRSSRATTTSTKPMSTLGIARHVRSRSRSSTRGAWPNQCQQLAWQ